MVSTDFRSQTEKGAPATDESANQSKDAAQSPISTKAEVPYSSYEDEKGNPFVADYYELGSLWNKDKAYTTEVISIEEFIKGKIKAKEVANSLVAVKSYLKDLEFTVGAKGHEPKATRMNKLLNYIEIVNDKSDTTSRTE